MKIDKLYIEGVLDATLEDFEQNENRIDPDKGLEYFFGYIYNSKDSKQIIGCKVEMTWITKLSHDIDDNIREDLWVKVYSKDTIAGFKADVYDMFDQINKYSITK
ncbi:MAG: hypothetical protein ACK6D3_08675 [Planctomycetaceae bacterium]|jgi:hypothetical protein